MADFKTLGNRFRVMAQNVEVNANLLVRKVALVIDQSVVLSTPVDTGRARANWQVSINAPVSGEVTYPAPKKGGGAETIGAAGPSSTFAIEAAIEATAGFAGGSIWITNNLPYIQPLNDGHSQQAPANFVHIAVTEGIAAIKEVKLLEAPAAED